MIRIGQIIERLIENIGKIASILILAILAMITFEVVSRYVFNSPTSWVWLISKQVFGVYIILAGSYALIHHQHIRIEIFYDLFPRFVKTIIRFLTLLIALFFLGSLLWKGSIMGWEAWKYSEKAVGVFKLPLYPLKMFIPIGTALFILGCLVVFLRKNQE